jgi:GNAT superfamily N-acetyltransferase
MRFRKKIIPIKGIKIFIEENNKEIARAFIYFLKNDLEKQKFGYLEDVFVNEEFRNKGLGTKIIKKIISEAKKNKCYKIVATSRFKRENVHNFYQKLGFKKF